MFYTGDCMDGYFCTLGASTATPTDGSTGNVCPEGHYCVNGTSTPTPCADGKNRLRGINNYRLQYLQYCYFK